MRRSFFVVALFGCIGHADLGDEVTETAVIATDAGSRPEAPVDVSDPAPDALTVELTASATSESCGACFVLIPYPSGGTPPYTLLWEDGTDDPIRLVCPGPSPTTYVAQIRDDAGRAGRASVRLLSTHQCEGDAATGAADDSEPLLCLQNGSFEGPPGVNLGDGFNGVPWVTCAPAGANGNTPDLLAARSAVQGGASLPPPTDGETMAGMAEGESLSQELCEPLQPGDQRSFEIDLHRLPLTDILFTDTEPVFLRVWGGTAADCSWQTLLWSSPAVPTSWQRYCVTVHPQHFTDHLVLEAASDQSAASLVYLLVDSMKPVASCP